MQYDFTSIMDRHGKDALAVDGPGSTPDIRPTAPKDGFSLIPMWVADMNFPTAPSITEAIIERSHHRAFGYFTPTDEYYKAIIDWHRIQNGVKDLKSSHIGYENSVLGGLMSALNAFASPGDGVLLHSPTYIGFTHAIENGGYHIAHSPLVLDENGVWRMDYEDMDRQLKENHIHVAVFCSPHNPSGRVWEREELERAMQVYKNNDCIVISDEIWSDILINNHKHIPTQSVSDDARNRTIALYAPTKTFNLAGLVNSYHIIYNSYLQDRVVAQSSKSHYNEMNVLSMHSLIGAYSETGREWLEQLLDTLSENVNYAYNYITKNFPEVSLFKPEGTYMLLLDCTQWCEKHGVSIQEIEQRGWDVGVAWQDGEMFHAKNSIRVNLALPKSLLEEAMQRLSKYVFVKK
ncbi:MalY/PatB family protein [Alloscardovia criceti]|uniref:MalY/PatB family protein n=1 Tax=Alloscardovia criceti TaxID=356828 RepID=UPI0003795989|nr:aminotransferase class I/II-fold pyridoxal phosphate-dependent enzyme [Alloscardovia criceti]